MGKGNFRLWKAALWLGLALLTGCSYLPAWMGGDGGRAEKPLGSLADYSELCYQRGLRYLYDSRYELAKEQFGLAASAALTPEEREVALAGIVLVDRMRAERR